MAGIATGAVGCALMLAAVIVPALVQPRLRGHHLRSAMHLRGIHQGQIFFAQANNRWFAGFDRNGNLDTDHVFDGEPQSADWKGHDQSTPRAPAWRFRRLLEHSYFTGEYCVDPIDPKTYWSATNAVDPSNFSYALLRIEGDADSPRKREHRETNNAMAAVLSDRAIRRGAGYKSLQTHPDDTNTVSWKGHVAWNDNHVTLEGSAIVATRYDRTKNANDNLFTESDPSGQPNAEAAMAWKSAGDTDAELME